ncbi:MAG: S24/S26 family peptidase [Actinomycetes bacterium]
MSDERRPASGLPHMVVGRALVRVRGASMEPTLHDGDLLLVRAQQAPDMGSLVVVRLPDRPGLSVKRVVGHDHTGWWVERDNPREGVDSWVVGAIEPANMLAQVVARLWPPRRIGPPPRL